MKSVFFAGAALVAMTGTAQATVGVVPFTGNGTNYTGTFSTSHAGAFSDTWTFEFLPAGFIDASIINIAFSPAANIDFTSVTLNGVSLSIDNGDPLARAYTPNQIFSAGGLNTLTIAGIAGASASYSGTINYTVSAVPEPATWGMMIAGFGIAGYALRRRRVSASFA